MSSTNSLMLSPRYGARTAQESGVSLRDLYGAVDDMLDEELEEDDFFGDDDDNEEDEEYGLLGIAVTKKSRQKKWLGKIVELQKKNKALRRMKSAGREEATRASRKGIAGIGKKTVNIEEQIGKNNEDLVKAKKEYLQAGGTEAQIQSTLRALPGHAKARSGPKSGEGYGAQPDRARDAAEAFAFSVGESVQASTGGRYVVSTPIGTPQSQANVTNNALTIKGRTGVIVTLSFSRQQNRFYWTFQAPTR